MIEYLDKIKDLNVLVIGETIIDEYQYGYTLGKAGKFPIVAFKNIHKEVYTGGILAIHKHLKDFCNVEYMTGDENIVKKRYVQNGQKLFETYDKCEGSYLTRYYRHRDINIKDFDLVIVADFGHGFITKELKNRIMNDAPYIALNAQSNAGNMGMNTINKYEKADYICLSEDEFRLAFSNQFDDIKEIIKDNIEDEITIAITRGKKGCLLYKNGEFFELPAFVDNPTDSVGAGDTFLAITSPLAYINAPIEVIAFIGSCVGAMACKYQGNKESITKEDLIKYIGDRNE